MWADKINRKINSVEEMILETIDMLHDVRMMRERRGKA